MSQWCGEQLGPHSVDFQSRVHSGAAVAGSNSKESGDAENGWVEGCRRGVNRVPGSVFANEAPSSLRGGGYDWVPGSVFWVPGTGSYSKPEQGVRLNRFCLIPFRYGWVLLWRRGAAAKGKPTTQPPTGTTRPSRHFRKAYCMEGKARSTGVIWRGSIQRTAATSSSARASTAALTRAEKKRSSTG